MSPSALDVYSKACADFKVKPNSHFSSLLSEQGPSAFRSLSLSRTFVGSGNCLDALLATLAVYRHEVRSADFSHVELATEHVKKLCEVLVHADSLTSVSMCNCGLYLESAQALLTLLRRNKNITTLRLHSDERLPTPNAFPETWHDRFARQLQVNRATQ